MQTNKVTVTTVNVALPIPMSVWVTTIYVKYDILSI